MQQIDEGRLRFFFPDNTVASKYDDWSFYRNQFNSAVDASNKVGQTGEQLEFGF